MAVTALTALTAYPLVLLGFLLADPRVPVVDRQQTTPDSRRTFGDMSTDRPDITDSTDIVASGIWQIESGLSFQSDRHDNESAHELAAPLAMLRVGLGHRVELRLSTDGVLSDTLDVIAPAAGSSSSLHTHLTGRADIEVGAKWKLFGEPRHGLLLALEPVLSLPTGSGDFSSGGYDPTLKMIVDTHLPRDFSLSGNVVVSSQTDDDRRFTQNSVSLSLSHGLPGGWPSGWHVYAELYRASALQRGGRSAWIADTGATHAIGRRVQVDLSIGRGLSDAAPDWFIGAGFALRGFLPRR